MSKSRRAPSPYEFIFLPLIYFLGATIGTSLTFMPEGMAVLWPPNSLLLAAFLIHRGRGWPVFAAGAFAAEVAADLTKDYPLPAAALFGVANVTEATICYLLLRRWRFNLLFADIRDWTKFVVAGPLMAALVAALIGGGTYTYFRGVPSDYPEFFRIWWFGDALGLMILTPVFLCLWARATGRKYPAVSWRPVDLAASVGGVLLLALFLSQHQGMFMGMHVGPVLLFPFVIYAAVRFTIPWTALVIAVIAFSVIGMTTSGRELFGPLSVRANVLRVQEFVLTVSLIGLGLGALLNKIRATQAKLEKANIEIRGLNEGLETRVRERTRELEAALGRVKRLEGLLPVCSWCNKVRDDKDYWVSVDEYIRKYTDARVSHGICPDCYEKQVQLMKEGKFKP